MPGRKAKPPRLYFRDDEGTWIIIDRGRQIRTGCGRGETEKAARQLEAYLGTRHKPTVGNRDPAALAIADVITFYEENQAAQKLRLSAAKACRTQPPIKR